MGGKFVLIAGFSFCLFFKDDRLPFYILVEKGVVCNCS